MSPDLHCLVHSLLGFLRDPAGIRIIQQTSENRQLSTHHGSIVKKSQSNMAPTEPSYLATARPGCPISVKALEDDLKSSLVKVIEAFKEEMNECLNKIQDI